MNKIGNKTYDFIRHEIKSSLFMCFCTLIKQLILTLKISCMKCLMPAACEIRHTELIFGTKPDPLKVHKSDSSADWRVCLLLFSIELSDLEIFYLGIFFCATKAIWDPPPRFLIQEVRILSLELCFVLITAPINITPCPCLPHGSMQDFVAQWE